MKNLLLAAFAVFSLTFGSCKNDKKDEPEVKTVEDMAAADMAVEDTQPLKFNDEVVGEIFIQYNDLKNALVDSDAEMASLEASNLITALADKGVEENVLKAAQNIVEATNVEDQRVAFVAVTTGVEAILAGTLDEGTIYKQYCPMAFDNKGASWLSSNKEIRNPYFGNKMLKCGRVEAEIK